MEINHLAHRFIYSNPSLCFPQKKKRLDETLNNEKRQDREENYFEKNKHSCQGLVLTGRGLLFYTIKICSSIIQSIIRGRILHNSRRIQKFKSVSNIDETARVVVAKMRYENNI